jgi:hypothetical protein
MEMVSKAVYGFTSVQLTSRTSQANTQTMRNKRVIALVSRMVVICQCLVETTNGITDSMAKMNSSISKSNSCKCSGQQHLTSGFCVAHGVFGNSWQILDCLLQGPKGEDIGDGVTSLVSWPLKGVLWSRDSLVVGNRCVTLRKKRSN